jgi:3',5'-cyclic AMP phosphodiesterase CpdA
MKIVHLSDTHINTKILYNIDAQDRFRLALNHIKNNHSDADHFMITGDLTNFGDNESYEIFINILSKVTLPNHLYPKLIIGNHDNRENFKNNFPNIKTDKNGFVQYVERDYDKTFVFLDTNLEGTDAGHLCNKRLQWLKDTLEIEHKNKIYIFMHHNPLATGHIESDDLGLVQREDLKNILLKYQNSIKHIFFGHQHITCSGKYLDITFSSPRSTWSPLVPNFLNRFRLGTANTDPNYNIILLEEDSLIVHSEDFLKTDVNWFTDN